MNLLTRPLIPMLVVAIIAFFAGDSLRSFIDRLEIQSSQEYVRKSNASLAAVIASDKELLANDMALKDQAIRIMAQCSALVRIKEGLAR